MNTLESGIDVGKVINVGPGKSDKKEYTYFLKEWT